MGDVLARLGHSLQSDEALRSVAALTQAVAGITDLDAGTRIHGEALNRLSADSAEIAKHLETLRRIVAEITALAINGKIQAALVATAGVDFSVFTAEIGRLGTQAGQQIEQAVGRLASVRAAIAGAIQTEVAFLRNEAGELRNIRARIEHNIVQMSERARRAAQAVEAVESKSRQVADKVGRTIGELQINDITCQRIEHVRLALRQVAGDETAPRLALAACRLQRLQLDEAARDYVAEIEALIGNLRGLSQDAADLLDEADNAFGDRSGGLFLTEIENDVARAVALLDAYAAGEERTRATIALVSQGFTAMSADLEAIRSIDADMRVMGLNATLKCGRLGNAGQALGVVAQELRACSRRTEDSSRTVADLLRRVLADAGNLGLSSAASETAGEPPARIMTGCVAGLGQLSAAMGEAMDHLHGQAPAVARRLAGGADGIAFHHRLAEECRKTADSITALADGLDDGAPLGDEEFDALRRLVEASYTMDSERLVHQRFDGRGSAPVASKEDESLDDLFF